MNFVAPSVQAVGENFKKNDIGALRTLLHHHFEPTPTRRREGACIIVMTNRPRDPFITLEIQASCSDPTLRSPKVSPPILRRGGTKQWKESPSPNASATTAATFSVTLLSSEPWSPLSPSLSTVIVEDHAKALNDVRERAHSVNFLDKRNCDPDRVIEPPCEFPPSTFLIFYYVWTPSFSPADVCSRIVSSWSRLQVASLQAVRSGVSSSSDDDSNPTAIDGDAFVKESAASKDGDTYTSTTPVPPFPSSLIDETDEAKHSDENGIIEPGNCKRECERCNFQPQVYLVIDQLLGHGSDQNIDGMDCQAKSLAKKLATTPEIRSLCEGVSICVSYAPSQPTFSAAAELLALSSTIDTAVPASPGLELVRQALLVGDNQRMLQVEQELLDAKCSTKATATKSSIGVIATDPSDFDGLRSLRDASLVNEPDSAAFVDDDAESTTPRSHDMPCRVTDPHSNLRHPMTVVAEWNGMGNLFAFAQRAHAAWRQSVGWPPEPRPRPPPRKIPRRIRRCRPPVASPQPSLIQVLPAKDSAVSAYAETSKLRRREEFRQDAVATLLIVCYLWFHFAEDCRMVFWLLLAPSGHAEVAQYLREWR